MTDCIFIALIGISFGYFMAKKSIKTAFVATIIMLTVYILFTASAERGTPILNQIRSALRP
jgi:uncharacterized membrane protein